MRYLNKALVVGSVLLVVFCVSFFVFYKRAQRNLPKQPLILTSAVIDQPLPKANLVNISGEQLADEKLRRGKVVLVFTLIECQPCSEENEFLKTVVGTRKEVTFIYVIPFGIKDTALKNAQSKYAVETFFDDHSMLSRSLQVYQVPIKIFLNDGIIKKTWVDSSFDNERKAEFRAWLSGV